MPSGGPAYNAWGYEAEAGGSVPAPAQLACAQGLHKGPLETPSRSTSGCCPASSEPRGRTRLLFPKTQTRAHSHATRYQRGLRAGGLHWGLRKIKAITHARRATQTTASAARCGSRCRRPSLNCWLHLHSSVPAPGQAPSPTSPATPGIPASCPAIPPPTPNTHPVPRLETRLGSGRAKSRAPDARGKVPGFFLPYSWLSFWAHKPRHTITLQQRLRNHCIWVQESLRGSHGRHTHTRACPYTRRCPPPRSTPQHQLTHKPQTQHGREGGTRDLPHHNHTTASPQRGARSPAVGATTHAPSDMSPRGRCWTPRSLNCPLCVSPASAETPRPSGDQDVPRRWRRRRQRPSRQGYRGKPP